MKIHKISFKTLLSVILFIQIVISSFSYSQNEIFTNYSVKDGLPSSQVYKTIQDNIGNVWFLTDMGISKYDGYEFKNFSLADGLTDNVFFDAQKHENGSIWLLGMNGFITIITESGIKPFEHNNKLLQFSQNKPVRMFLTKSTIKIYYKGLHDYLQIDYEGNIIFHPEKIKETNRYYLLDSNNMFYTKNIISKVTSNIAFQSGLITKSYVRDYGFFMPDKTTLIFLYGKDTIKIKNDTSTKTVLFENYLKAGIIDTNHFWVSSKNNGLSIFNINGKRTRKLLLKNTISDIWIDPNKNMWISTLYDGVYKQQKTIVQNVIEDKNIRQLDKNGTGILYISFNSGDIIKKNKSTYSIISKSNCGDPSSIIFNKKNNTLYYYINGYIYRENNPIPLNKITSRYDITILPNNSFGISNSSGFNIFNNEINKRIFFGRTFSSIIYNKKILLGTNKGLYYQNNNKDSISFNKMKVYEKRINKIILFKNHIVLGTQGQGVLILNKKLTKIIARIHGEKIAGNFISNLIIKNDSTIWAATNQGFSELTFNNNFELIKSMTINQNHGLSSPQVNDVEIINDTLWIATKNGLFKMPVDYFNKISVKNYKLHFTDLKVNDIQQEELTFKSLRYNENRLSISFSTIDFNDLKNVYRYKLSGADSTWNYGKNRKTLYSNLLSGKYEYKVQVKGENQSWAENEISLEIQIFPPFWKTWWFILASISLMVLIVYLFFKYKILLYNKDILRELLRYFLKRIKRKDQPFIIVRDGNIDVKILSRSINYIKAERNYIMIFHDKGKTLSRIKISEFLTLVPDPIEYIQVRRSYIVRIDKIDQKGKKEISISGHTIIVGTTFAKELDNISF